MPEARSSVARCSTNADSLASASTVKPLADVWSCNGSDVTGMRFIRTRRRTNLASPRSHRLTVLGGCGAVTD